VARAIGQSTSPSLLAGLVDSNKDRREKCWSDFLERYRPLILSWCQGRGLGLADAEEITSTVLGRLVQVMQRFKYDPAQCFRSWLKTIVENEIKGQWRRHKRRPADRATGGSKSLRFLCALPATSAAADLAEELDAVLRRDLEVAYQIVKHVQSRVESRTWQAYWLTEIEGQPPAEAAKLLGMKIATLYVAKGRILKLLRKAREDHEKRAFPRAEEGVALLPCHKRAETTLR
jgi:RNA polymerase sigma factor (sigma-70 family)